MLHKKPAGALYDPMIIPRVKQYLEENVHQTYVDVGVMARELQDRYREYNRRKTVPFRMLVEQAYKTVLHSYGLDSNPSSDNEEEGNSDLEVMEEGGGGSSGRNANHMNDTLTNMYMNSGKAKAGGSAAGGGGAASGGDGDAIDISSDEDDEGGNSRDKEKAVSTTSDRDRMKVIETQIASNKHITVTKVTRGGAEKPRSGDEAVDSSNGSTNGRRAAEQQGLHQAKRRRLEQAQNSEISNSNSNPLLPGYPAIVPAASSRNVEKQHQQKLPQPAKVAPAGGKSERPKRFKKEIWSKLVDTCFLDVGGMDKILRDLCELLLHVKHPEVYRHIGLPPPRGFLLHGPPGSGKTLLAHAIAGQLKIGLIEIAATELVAGVSGESEERIREVFEQAAILSPCVLFIDEIDAISANRVNAQKDMERRVVAQLLSSLDGLSRIEGGDEVLVIGATNRPDALDPALRRVGRFDQEISLGIPDRDARAQILKIICKNLKLEQSINYDELAKLTPGYVGADLLALVTRAATTAIKRMLTERERHQLLVEATRERDLVIQLRKAEQERLKQLAKKPVVDDEVMEVDESAKSKLNGNTSVDDVVALEDDVEEVVNLDDDKEEEKSAEAEKTTSEEEKKVDETADKDAAKPDEAEAKPAEGEDKKEAEGDEKKPDEEAKPAEAEAVAVVDDADVEMAADSSTPAEKDVVPVEEPKPSSTEVVEAPAESSEAVAEAEKPAEVDTSAETPAAAAEPQPDPEPEVELMEEEEPELEPIPLPTLDLPKLMNLLLDHTNPLADAELDSFCIERDDFLDSLKSVQPSAKREGFITVPDVTWNDIGSLGDIREELKLAILAPVKFPNRLKMLGLSAPSGVLLCGPPGCGKTLLAKAVANEAGINFISVKGPELLNMYVGESERAVRQCFQRARNSAPCVIFFDEFDSLCPKRSDSAEGGAGMRVVNQLLTEMDGIEDRKGVFLMAATNRPDIVDPAVLRPGRLDKILYVGLPAEPDRADILRALTKNRSQPPLAEDVELGLLARLTEGYTGADLAGLVRQASLQTLKDSIDACDGGAQEEASSEEAEEQQLVVELRHFQEAIRNIKPSVNEEDKKHYERLKRKYGSPAAQ
ncbi:nuclear valosin-containing protein-like [Culex quinquefasciatus]|uniref:nuclear valosin-containing protein-like n=1 Tax=Culex quinquefasciatus TaxID=7176 RepID=UPI0018E30264|nr:nuclear valosin-containing protein-like [Culex quinquefasciatus]